jgi:adenosylcobalamin-dependent ribonucleoside-triphosphate reductase
MIEYYAFRGHSNVTLILDFSQVRHRGQPIRGMQNRPASGPGPLMEAIRKIAAVKGSNMEPWMATMFIDHFLAECVLVGGARRAARMATKYWKDAGILDFIQLKRGGFLWSSNNSILVDDQFWRESRIEGTWAKRVFDAAIEAAYHDGTGEPGFINVDKLEFNDEGIEAYIDGSFVDIPEMQAYLAAKARACLAGPYHVITNPCGEIVLFLLGGYCVIADVVPYFAVDDDDAEEAFRVAVRALIRTNQMRSLYQRETQRTNRIGVGFTGLFEFALKRFGYGWHDLVDETQSQDFWLLMKRFSDAVKDEAALYARELGVTVPHTATTVKPAGTTSKLFNLSEGAHLPAMLWYLRWVQFRNDDPLIEEYRAKGYPFRQLQTYNGTTIVGFPTKPLIVELAEGMGLEDKLVTAAQATPEEQYQWLRLLEKYWIGGPQGNQVSYTLKYEPKKVTFDEFKATILDNQPTVKCCSVMPQIDGTVYEYQPEEPVMRGYFEYLVANIEAASNEDIDLETLKCASGACPI